MSVRSLDSAQLLSDAGQQEFDLSLAMADENLRRKTPSTPRCGTLNAHPARNPEYRVLSSLEGECCETVCNPRPLRTSFDAGSVVLRLPIEDEVVRDGAVTRR